MSDEQNATWNGPRGQIWVEAQEFLDRMFQPVADILADAVSAKDSVSSVLDVGCGTGATTLAAAQRLGAKGKCVGVDISEPMLALARDRAARGKIPANFILADAQTYPFEPATFDRIISRFGVMFFDDPVAAFANLRHALKKNGELQVITWRPPEENPIMTAAEKAAAPLLPDLPPRRPDGPGQFALGDPQKVRAILEQSGWREIDMQPIDVACAFPATELDRFATKLGPIGPALQELDESTREKVVAAIRPAFAPFIHGSEVRFNAACWMIRAS